MPDQYRRLLRTPSIPVVLVAGTPARLGVSMYGLALLLLTEQETGSLAVAGGVAAAAATGYAVTGPALGRLTDRYGSVRPLVGSALANALAFGTLLVLTGKDVPAWSLPVVAIAVGASVPPVSACQRAVLRRRLTGREDLLDTALTLDSLQLDAFLVAGPLLVTGLTLLGGPHAAVVAAAALLVTGAVLFAALPACRARRVDRTSGTRGLGPLREPGFLLLVGTIAAAGMALGAVRVSLIGFADSVGDAAAGGLLFTAIGIGSAAAGVWYGARRWSLPLERRYALLLACYAASVLPLLSGLGAVPMFLLAIVTGLALTPVTVCEFALVGHCAPTGTVAEAFAWGTTATFAGNALGSGAAGVLADGFGWRFGIASAALVLALATIATVTGRGLLTSAQS